MSLKYWVYPYRQFTDIWGISRKIMNRDSTTNFIRALGVTDRDFVCISGGGGKTSLLFCLQKQLSLNGQRSLVSTTAKMMIPEDQENMFFSPVADSRAFADYFLRHVSGSTYLAGGIGNGKATAVSERTLSELAHLLRGKAALLAETDGAARKPYRIRKPHDPGIPLGTTLMIHVIGAELAGAVLSEENLNRCPDCLTGKKADRKQIRELLSENRPPDPEQVPQVL
ncbi:MAG: selenium cofactor biosynthesis protein YqeC, partial [Eubacteriaceae bacterium]